MITKYELPLGIQTPEGREYLTPEDFASNPNPSLYTFNYITGKRLKVRSLIRHNESNICKLTYSDNREMFYRFTEPIYLDRKAWNLDSILKFLSKRQQLPIADLNAFLKSGQDIIISPDYPELSLESNAPVEYRRWGGSHDQRPDPYTAGALYPNADLTLPYVNFPGDWVGAMDSINITHNTEIMIGNNIETVYLKRKGDKDDTPLRWKEFVSPFVRSWLADSSEDIPLCYLFATKANRWEFIRGLFDLTYPIPSLVGWEETLGRKIIPSLDMEIRGKYLNRLIIVQNILHSLGVMSKIANREKEDSYRPYVLELITDPWSYTKCFNDVTRINIVTKWINDILKKHPALVPPSKIYVKKIEYAGLASTVNLKMHTQIPLYVTDNFLPRYSGNYEKE